MYNPNHLNLRRNFDSGSNSVFGGLASTALNFALTANLNKKNRAFAREMFGKSSEFATSEREASQAFQTSERQDQNNYAEQMYLKYQYPQALASQYMAAGLNPNVALTGTPSMSPSSGSTGGAPSGVVPAAPSPTSFAPPSISSEIGQIASAFKSIGEAKKLGVETDWLENSLGEDYKNKKLLNHMQEMVNDNYQKFGSQKERALVTKLLQDVETGVITQQNLKEEWRRLCAVADISEKERDKWLDVFEKDMEVKDADINLKNSSAGLADAQAATEPYKRRNLEASTEGLVADAARTWMEANKIYVETQQVKEFKSLYKEQLEKSIQKLGSENADIIARLVNQRIKNWNLIHKGREQIDPSIVKKIFTDVTDFFWNDWSDPHKRESYGNAPTYDSSWGHY